MESTNIGVMSCMHVLCYAFIGGEQDDNKFLEQLVTSLLSSTTLYQVNCQQAVDNLSTSWETTLIEIAVSLLFHVGHS
jgi:hypothetical protein